MGKYSKLRGVVPTFEEDVSYQAKVNDAKQLLLSAENLEAANVNRLAALFAARKAMKDAHEETISELNVEIEALSQLLCDALEDQSIQKVELASGAVLFLQDTPYPKVVDKEALLEWIKKNKMSSLLGINHQTLKGLTNELLVSGKPAPVGVEVYLKTQARIRNAKNGDYE